MIKKIRDFIIGCRFKKYGHFRTRLDNIKEYPLSDIKNYLRACLSFFAASTGGMLLRQIQLTPATTKEEKQKKALAIAQNIINTNQAICKAWSMF